jgi:hypothetical protein
MSTISGIVGIAEQVVVGDLEPHPGVVVAQMTQAHPSRGSRHGEHLHPVVNRERAIVRVDELGRAMPLHLLDAPAQELRHRLVDLHDDPPGVLHQRGEARGDIARLLERLFALVPLARLVHGDGDHRAMCGPQVEHVELARHVRPAHGVELAPRGPLRQHPFPGRDQLVVEHEQIGARPRLQHRVAPQRHRLRHRHHDPVLRQG